MISVNRQGQRVQLRAAAVVLHEDDVLLHRAPGDERWALPGGRVAFGEEASTTAVRDMKEELGEAVSCGPFLNIGENLIDLAGQRNHEFGLYFLVSLGCTENSWHCRFATLFLRGSPSCGPVAISHAIRQQ